MSLSPLTDLSPALHLHLWAAVFAIALGPVALFRRRRDRWHKIAGYTWVSAMALLAGASLLLEAHVIPLAFGFGPLHGLSILVLVTLWRGVAAARAGHVALHRARMRALYAQALLGAGLFTLLPGRTLNAVLFSSRPEAGYVAIAVIATGIVASLVWQRRARAAG